MLASNIKVKSGFWEITPWLSFYTANAIYPNIYLPKEIYQNLDSKNPDHKNMAILIHEQAHIERQKKMGWFLWGLKYLFLPRFRFNEELEAIKAQMDYLKKHKIKFDIERSAKFLSSWLYLWPVSYEGVKKELEKVWKQI